MLEILLDVTGVLVVVSFLQRAEEELLMTDVTGVST